MTFGWNARLLAIAMMFGCSNDRAAAPDLTFATPTYIDEISSESLKGYSSVDAVLGLDSLRAIAVVDGGESVVQFTWGEESGTVIARKGRGPGEVLSASWLGRTGRDGFVVVEGTGGSIHWYRNDLSLIRSTPVPSGILAGAWMTQRGLVLRISESTLTMAFVRIEEAGEPPTSILSSASSMDIPTQSCRYCPATVARSGTIVAAASDTSYRLLRWDSSGDSLSPITRSDVPAVSFSTAEQDSISTIWTTLQQNARARGRDDIAQRLRVLAESPRRRFKTRFASTGLIFDDAGWLFVQLNVSRGAEEQLDVFDSTGAYRGSIGLKPGSTVRDVFGGTLLVTREDSLGLITIERLQLR